MPPDWPWFKDVSHYINVAPPHTLDLTSHKTLCGIIKEYVAARHYCTNRVALGSVMGLHHHYCTDVTGTSHRTWQCSGLYFEHGNQQPMNLSKNITEYNV
jgi:hypothetical protein